MLEPATKWCPFVFVGSFFVVVWFLCSGSCISWAFFVLKTHKGETDGSAQPCATTEHVDSLR